MLKDRRDAGRQLARLLSPYAGLRPVVVALPRGGVPVAAEIALSLGAPLDILVVRKIGLPWQPELGIGALAEGGVCVLDRAIIREIGLMPRQLEAAIDPEVVELTRRVHRYRGGRTAIPLRDRLVILVDDGLATGNTARAAIECIRRAGASRIVLAVPVASPDTIVTMRGVADEVIALETPRRLGSIGEQYGDFTQMSDEDVLRLLERVGAADPTVAASVAYGAGRR